MRYEVVDVFTATPFAGNPLAVVLGTEGLATEQLQALAREFHLSETAFPTVLEDDPDADYAMRIFTPETELPFAGHPTVGTAWVLARLGHVLTGPLRQRCGAGTYDLDVAAAPGGGPGRVELDGGAPDVGGELAADRLLEAVGLGPDDVAAPPRRAGTGLGWTHLTVRHGAVARAVADVTRLRAVADLAPVGVYLHEVHHAPHGLDVRARAFTPELGVTEDPATGSAALGLGGHLVASGLAPGDGTTAYVVRQGVEMGRPSVLHALVAASGGAATGTRVAGDVVPVASGEVRVP
ncbi:PhzF family phenazine biosynthesis protein [Vallicoccus soli]|uniref:PhzF family phenazine biosynthesis protein n=1 Tax=Vallicoccus soli TaxID=2339232 RepID=A0A3A3ZNG6_9ACTN|nr:PhzF family phenazine biosynthesis protein [Vallicoccus soli]